jgi:hypothetical protein
MFVENISFGESWTYRAETSSGSILADPGLRLFVLVFDFDLADWQQVKIRVQMSLMK